MAGSKRFSVMLMSFALAFLMMAETGITVEAGSSKNYLNELKGGVATILDPAATNATEIIDATAKELNLDLKVDEDQTKLVMANVKDALNVRSEASEEADKVGKLYKDCGGTILERKNGWTKLQSGNVVGWAKDEYLLFDEEATALANDVGRMLATVVETESLRIRMEASADAGTYRLAPRGEVMEVIDSSDPEWICVDHEGQDAYVSAEFVNLDFQIDSGETMEEIKAREEAEREAKRNVNYGEYTTDADTTRLLAALIQCEAGGESYEGQLAVGAVVMNRVRSGAYPDSIHGVIYASGQFTPALNGKVNNLYESGKISQSCLQAAADALAGTSNVGSVTHFRRNNGREGIVIGNHVFY